MPHSSCKARWMSHPQALASLLAGQGAYARTLRSWLADTGSMTLKLKARSDDFSVRLLRQRPARSLADEHAMIGLPRASRVVERDVILHCDGRPVVFGHTVIATTSVKTDWPFFSRLGNTPLGANLFFDPLVRRYPIQFARLPVQHPLVQRIARALHGQALPSALYARRSLFRRRGGVMMVTDVFLPALDALMRAEGRFNQDNP